MNNKVFKHEMIEQSRKIIESLISKTLLADTEVLILNEILVFVVDNTLLYEIPLKNPIDIGIITFKYSDILTSIEELELDSCYPDIYIQNKLNSVYYNYKNRLSDNLIVAQNTQLRDDEIYESLTSLRAGEGMKYYNMIGKDMVNYKIPVFNGFPNLNKQDEIGMTVYDMLDQSHLLVDMNIFKKKINRNIHIYFRILKLN